MRYGRAAAIVVSLVAATWATTARAQPRQPTFRARTVVTELEVHVVDAAGRPVADLTPDDFAVTEDGVSQVLIGVEASGQAPGATAAPAAARATVDAHVPSPEAAVPAGTALRATNRRDSDTRAWALVVDDLRTPGLLREQMKACLQALVDGLPAGDFVALVPTSGDRRAAREFTRDRDLVREAIGSLRFLRESDGVRGVHFMATMEHPRELVSRPLIAPPRQDLGAADNLLISSIGNAALMLGRAGAPRGTIVLLSQGMAVALSEDYRHALVAQGDGSVLRRYEEWRELLERVQRSGVTLHVIDPTGFDEGLARRLSARDRLVGPTARMRGHVALDDPFVAARVVAEKSGGTYVTTNAPTAAAGQVLAASSAGYVLRYVPSRDALDDRLRDVRVTVRRPGVTVRARTAYARVSDPAFEALRAEKPLGVAVAAAVPSADLGLEAVTRVTPMGTKARPSVSVSVVDAPGAPLPPRDILEVLAIVVDMKGKTVTKAGGRAEVTAAGASLATPDLVLEPLKPGRYQLRVAVRSVALDRTGAVFLDLDIPQR